MLKPKERVFSISTYLYYTVALLKQEGSMIGLFFDKNHSAQNILLKFCKILKKFNFYLVASLFIRIVYFNTYMLDFN